MDISHFNWINPPASWTQNNDKIIVKTDLKTDFWRETHYGFIRHNGHIFGCEVEGDFTFELCIEGEFSELYDQAGLMIEQGEEVWCKAGIEFADEQALMSSVLTNGKSDWATGPFHGDTKKFWMRATVMGDVLRLQYSGDGITWPLLRLCTIPLAQKRFVGAMCCTPEREGLQVAFSQFRLSQPLGKDLHDLS
ncbi:DUF1349 domain-containing protein [Vibrio neptunius]|uniref:DUF1349 domain-containing protein n=1 Tax=Vibrio neptunius TaxID=170651 RepID=UPI0019D27F3E|nr:DUF1349 domain-containing protein [Vibrio neptunius]MBN3574673.1 DUF1349 domain-containing protein [Vibrio neptunius]QXX09436.1 DUF1349 domain-containing protein [Vibrio neptunius]